MRLKEIVSGKVCPLCLVVTSPDRVRRERALVYLLDQFISKGSRPSTFSFGEQGRLTISSFLNDIGEPSLFEPVRFAVFRSLEKAKVIDLEPLSAFIARQIKGVHLILIGDGLPNSPNFKKEIAKFGIHCAFEELKGAELSRWTEKELRQSGVEDAPDQVVELVLSLATEDPDDITHLIEKFSLYLNGDPPTTVALSALEPGRSIASDFTLADSLLGSKRIQTEVLLHQLLNQGSVPMMLMGLLTKTFVTIFRIRTLLDRGFSQQDVRNDLALTPWLFTKYLPLAKRLSIAQIEHCTEVLLKTDFRLKDRSLGPAALLSSLAYNATPSNGRLR